MKKLIGHIIVMLIPIFNWAQQDAQYTQYMYNMSIINPAYTIENSKALSMGVLHRSQWTGMIGAPKTSTVFLRTPLKHNIQTGFSIANDNIGDVVSENNFFADIAYKLNFEKHGSLSFGIKTGITLFDVNFNDFKLESGDVFTDPNFQENINKTFFNFGAGIYYNTENFYIGASIPNLLKAKHLNRNNGKYQGTEEPHLFITGGFVFNLSDELKLKPAFMHKSIEGFPSTIDFTANLLFNNKVEFGIGYRVDDSFSGLINLGITPNLRIGYAYDHTISNLGTFNSGSHEIMLLYNIFTKNGIGYNKSPRFF